MYDYLEHHGIKGMKWGVRRTEAQLGHDTSKGSSASGGSSSGSSQKKSGLLARWRESRQKKRDAKRNAELEAYANDWVSKHWTESWNAEADDWESGSKAEKQKKYNDRLSKAKNRKESSKIQKEMDTEFQTDFGDRLAADTNRALAEYKKQKKWS